MGVSRVEEESFDTGGGEGVEAAFGVGAEAGEVGGCAGEDGPGDAVDLLLPNDAPDRVVAGCDAVVAAEVPLVADVEGEPAAGIALDDGAGGGEGLAGGVAEGEDHAVGDPGAGAGGAGRGFGAGHGRIGGEEGDGGDAAAVPEDGGLAGGVVVAGGDDGRVDTDGLRDDDGGGGQEHETFHSACTL